MFEHFTRAGGRSCAAGTPRNVAGPLHVQCLNKSSSIEISSTRSGRAQPSIILSAAPDPVLGQKRKAFRCMPSGWMIPPARTRAHAPHRSRDGSAPLRWRARERSLRACVGLADRSACLRDPASQCGSGPSGAHSGSERHVLSGERSQQELPPQRSCRLASCCRTGRGSWSRERSRSCTDWRLKGSTRRVRSVTAARCSGRFGGSSA